MSCYDRPQSGRAPRHHVVGGPSRPAGDASEARRWRGRISRLRGWLLYALFLALVAELVLRVALSSAQVIARLGPETDVSRRVMWYALHSGEAEIYYRFDRFDEKLGWTSKPSVPRRARVPQQTVNTNSAGFRGARDFALEKPPGVFRIAMLGDSFTFGDEVSDEETYPAKLQQLLPRAEVINMGVHGYAHDQMLLLFENEGVQYRPDLVVLGFVAVDMARNLLTFRDYAKPSFVLEDGTLRVRGIPVPPPEQLAGAASLRVELGHPVPNPEGTLLTRSRRSSRAR